MAWSRAALTKAVFAANGTNNYVLSDPASQGPYRTDAQAVADGSLASGNSVHYIAWRTTTTGDAEFERGHGAYTSASRTIARTAGNVLDSDAGPGVLKDWGLSGQVDILILEALDGSNIPDAAAFATNLGLARLAAANSFVDGQQISGTGGAITALSLVNLATAAVGNRLLYRYLMKDSAGNTDVYARIEARTEGVTSGAEEGALDFYVITGGATTRRLILTGSGLRDNSSNKYVAFPAGGTVKMLFSSVPPTGWTRVNETNQAIIRLAQSADTPNASGGSDSFFDGGWATAGHTLIESEIPAHVHDVRITGSSGGTDRGLQSNGVGVSTPGANTQSTGGGGSHAHNMTTPFYRIACWATFD